jgi:hypothetical protein
VIQITDRFREIWDCLARAQLRLELTMVTHMMFEDTFTDRLGRLLLGVLAYVMALIVVAPFALMIAAPFLFRL